MSELALPESNETKRRLEMLSQQIQAIKAAPHSFDLKWTPKTGQSNTLLLAVQERGKHAKETEVPHGVGEGSGGAGGGEGGQDVSELAWLHGVHPTLIHAWKKQLLDNAELASGLTTYFGYYNDERTHQSLEDRTPAEVYGKGSRSRKGCRAF